MKKALFAAAVLAAGLLTPVLFAAESNLLVNPGFEKADPAGWVAYGDTAYDTGAFKNGQQSGKLWVWDYGDGVLEQFVDVTPGKSYKASVYAMSKSGDAVRDGAKAWIQIEWCTKDGVVISDAVKSPAIDGACEEWKLLSTPAVIAPSGAEKAKVKVIMQSGKKNVDGSCYFDDAEFIAVPVM